MMPILVLAAAASFTCTNPSHHDGDAIRCSGAGKAMRLFGIDAPEMPGACSPGRSCTRGDPFASRDYLESLTSGRSIRCTQLDTDGYGRRVVRCSANGQDLSCAMVAAGHAVERYGSLECRPRARQSSRSMENERDSALLTDPGVTLDNVSAPVFRESQAVDIASLDYFPRAEAETGVPWIPISLWLLAINTLAYSAFALDKRRAIEGGFRRVNRIPEAALLALAAVGGSLGAISAQQQLRHKTLKQPFASRLLIIAGLQIGILIGIMALQVWAPV